MRAEGLWAMGVIVAACALACGGTTLDAGGGARDGGPSDDATADAGSSPCPTSPPAPEGVCSPSGLTCEWGTSPIVDCDTVATCLQGHWSGPTYHPPPGTCTSGTSPSCPSSFGAVPRNSHCSPYGTTCNYPEGVCACAVPAGPGAPLDASAVAEWICQDPQPGCPQPRPRLGSACPTEGLECDYGACSIPGGNAETCTNGVWAAGGVACPAAAAATGR